MKLSSSAQMREMDSYAINELNIAGTLLMSNAAEHVAVAAIEHMPKGGNVAVFCGTGNNGGDGIGAAAYLISSGVSVRVFLIGDKRKLSSDSEAMMHRLLAEGGNVEIFSQTSDIGQYVKSCSVIIDALFGIGLNSEISGEALLAVRMINESEAFVIAADIASGVQADTGAILGESVKANMTVTFSMAKPGHFVEPGCISCGELVVVDIGIPKELTDEAASFVFAVTSDEVRLPSRRRDAHKGDFGRVLIAAGCKGYTGAPALSALAASRMGAGLVFLGVPESIYDITASKLTEEMPFPLPADSSGKLSSTASCELVRRANECDVLLVGPGLGISHEITELVLTLIKQVRVPIVLDADGLNAISENMDVLAQAEGPLILTPHPGEFLRLGGNLSSLDRLSSAREFAHKNNCILVLKGHRPITSTPDGTAFISTTGGPAMAKGGSGDVLAGMIAALTAQKFPLIKAVTAAVYLHGLSGDICASELGEYSVTASDIISSVPKAAKQFIR
ncbi:MAG: NAD(P)H-hydrate dehydratase [Oscillospiraceae bacterium]|nr:NAD(P)H-hydrate dehydratase [Oscillospiraceae bacterium]